jgi:hypothetical protein
MLVRLKMITIVKLKAVVAVVVMQSSASGEERQQTR